MLPLITIARASGALLTKVSDPLELSIRAVPATETPTAVLEDSRLFTKVDPQ